MTTESPTLEPPAAAINNDWAAECDRLRKEIVDLRHDLHQIAEHLTAEAVEREWCSEYIDFVDEVNKVLSSSFRLPYPQRDFDISFTITCSPDQAGQLEGHIDRMLGAQFNLGVCTNFNYEEA